MRRLLVIFVLGLILNFCAMLFAKDFTAEYIAGEGKSKLNAKFYYCNGNIRIESPHSITIIKKGSKFVQILMPQQKAYMEIPYSQEMSRDYSTKVEGEIKREKLGTETVNGIKADKYKVVYMSKGKDYSFLQWIGKDIEIPIKSASLTGKVFFELKNLKIGSVPDSLFKVPSGYNKISYGMPKL